MKPRAERTPLILDYEITIPGTSRVLGLLLDITSGGIKMMTEHNLLTNSHLAIHLDFPRDFIYRRFLEANARVVWCSRSDDRTHWLVGLQFEGLDGETRGLLQAFIDEYRLGLKVSEAF